MFTAGELIDIVITIIAAGYILLPLAKNLKNAFILSGVSIVIHELSHKFVAMAFGFNAVYHANFYGLALGLILRMFHAPVFFVPAYVSISGIGSRIGYFFTALAGPLSNLIIFGITYFLSFKYNSELLDSIKIINFWLALINLMPFPGTDGYNALISILR